MERLQVVDVKSGVRGKAWGGSWTGESRAERGKPLWVEVGRKEGARIRKRASSVVVVNGEQWRWTGQSSS